MNSSDQNISKPVGWNYSSISAPEDSFPIRVEGRNKDSVYVDFHSQEAMLNFEKKKRAANMQTLCHCEAHSYLGEIASQVTLFPKI